jgi:hypothetical protein
MNKNHMIGVKYRISPDYEYEGPSPFRGLVCTVLDIGNYSKAGLDCFVKLHCTPEELAERYVIAHGIDMTAEDVIEIHGEQNLHTDGFKYEKGLYVEHDSEYLIPLIDKTADWTLKKLNIAKDAADETYYKIGRLYNDCQSVQKYSDKASLKTRAFFLEQELLPALNLANRVRAMLADIKYDNREYDDLENEDER